MESDAARIRWAARAVTRNGSIRLQHRIVIFQKRVSMRIQWPSGQDSTRSLRSLSRIRTLRGFGGRLVFAEAEDVARREGFASSLRLRRLRDALRQRSWRAKKNPNLRKLNDLRASDRHIAAYSGISRHPERHLTPETAPRRH